MMARLPAEKALDYRTISSSSSWWSSSRRGNKFVVGILTANAEYLIYGISPFFLIYTRKFTRIQYNPLGGSDNDKPPDGCWFNESTTKHLLIFMSCSIRGINLLGVLIYFIIHSPHPLLASPSTPQKPLSLQKKEREWEKERGKRYRTWNLWQMVK